MASGYLTTIYRPCEIPRTPVHQVVDGDPDTRAPFIRPAFALDYAALPKPVVAKLEQTLQAMKVQGKPLPLASAR